MSTTPTDPAPEARTVVVSVDFYFTTTGDSGDVADDLAEALTRSNLRSTLHDPTDPPVTTFDGWTRTEVNA